MFALARFAPLSSLLVCLLIGAGQASAAPFVDDFEGGNLGRWASPVDACLTCSFALSPVAVRRGVNGLRFSDGNTAAGARREGAVVKAVSGNPSASSFRFWFRLTSGAFGGSTALAQIAGPQQRPLAEVVIDFSNRRLSLGGADNAGTYVQDPTNVVVTDNVWYLFEVTVSGAGSGAGVRRLFVDGQLAANRSGVNFTGLSPVEWTMGQPSSANGSFVGVLDFDDVLADVAPLPSKVRLAGPAGGARVGDCFEVKVGLSDLGGSDAPASAATQVALTASGAAGGLFANAACTTAATSVSLAAGALTGSVYFKASATGTLTVSGTGADLGAGSASVPVRPMGNALGAGCVQNTECQSNFCADGVCCDSACGGGACETCKKAQGASADGTCTVLPATAVCRAAEGVCDVEERCTGTSAVCPLDSKAPSGFVCRTAEESCDVNEWCDGTSNSCPEDRFTAAGAECRAPQSRNDAAELCTGVTASCPPPGTPPGVVPVVKSDGGSPSPQSPSDESECAAGEFCRGEVNVGSGCTTTGEAALSFWVTTFGLLAAFLISRRHG